MSAPQLTRTINGQLCRLVCPKVSSLAIFLMQTFNMRPEDDVAFILSPHSPACNRTAMRHWVTEQLIDIATHRPENTLMVELELRLWDHLSRCGIDDALLSLEVPTKMAIDLKMPLPYWEPILGCDPVKRKTRAWSRQDTEANRPSRSSGSKTAANDISMAREVRND